jgi:mono/diheme cytochrome c family protein
MTQNIKPNERETPTVAGTKSGMRTAPRQTHSPQSRCRLPLATLSLAAITLAAALTVGPDTVRAQDSPGGGPSSIEISDEGKEVYETVCQACHMADAKGGGDSGAAIPALAGNDHLASKEFLVDILLKGRGGMPWFNDMLTHKQIASVATYVRGRFNNYAEPVTEADVDRAAATTEASPRDCATCS